MNPSHTLPPTARPLLGLLVIALALICPSLAPAAPEPTAREGPDRRARPARSRTR